MSKEIIVRYRDDNDYMAVRGGEYVQDLVRCKDCRSSFINENVDRKPLICGKTKMCGETTPDWFCADGEV